MEGYELLIKHDVDAVIPVVRFSYPIQRAFVLRNDYLQMLHPEHLNSRSQDLEPCFHDCGQFYWLKVDPYLKNHKFFTAKTMPLEIPETEVQDIDNLEDWKLAEMKYTLHSQTGSL